MGLLPAIDYAAGRLLKPGGRILPSLVRVWGALADACITEVSGFDLSTLNRYRWHPSTEHVQLDRHVCLASLTGPASSEDLWAS
jgi:hypothetical protein